jgi:hypothetical protein
MSKMDWSTWDWEKTPEADTETYIKLYQALGINLNDENRGDGLDKRVDVSEQNTVIRVYLDEKLVFTEFEDRFPSAENVARLRLLAL